MTQCVILCADVDAAWLEMEELDEIRQCRRLYEAECLFPEDLMLDTLYKMGAILRRHDEAEALANRATAAARTASHQSRRAKRASLPAVKSRPKSKRPTRSSTGKISETRKKRVSSVETPTTRRLRSSFKTEPDN